MWSRQYPCCIRCKTTNFKHVSRGLCNSCYLADYRKEHIERIAQQKRAWYERVQQGYEKQKIVREQKNFGGMRVDALTRDEYKCRKCGSKEDLTVHHIDGNGRRSKNPNNDLSNLLTVCRSCHINIHRAELQMAQLRYSPNLQATARGRRKRPAPPQGE